MENIKKFFAHAFAWYFSRNALPYWCILLLDSSIVVASMIVAMIINNGLLVTAQKFWPTLGALCVYLLCYMIGFRTFRTYQGIVRYSTFPDLYRIAKAVVMGSAIVWFVRHLLKSDLLLPPVSVRDLTVGSLISVLLMWGVRIWSKLAFETKHSLSHSTNIIIFGTKRGGVGIAQSIRNQHPSRYYIRGFISSYSDMAGHTLLNLPIFSDHDSCLWKFIEENDIRMVFVSPFMQDYFINDCQKMIDRFIKMGVKIMMVPQEQEWDGKSDIAHTALREVSVEDLLPRKKIEVDLAAIGEMLKGKRILITGAAGSIGGEMVRQVAKFEPAEMVLIDQAETPMHDIRRMMARKFPRLAASSIVTSISNASHMEAIFKAHRPEYVFHAAAYKHVPMMEDNPALAVQNNVYGTRVIADTAVKYGTKKFVMISTDKAVNPTNVMGCSKRICEIYCQALNKEIEEGRVMQADGTPAITQFVTTRFGNVLGSNGSVIPIFKDQILKGGPVTVTHPDIIRFFMLIPEACRLVLEAGTMGKGGEIFVFDMGEPVRIADLAQRMIDLMGATNCGIAYTGLRDGEKLYEEVLSDAEQTKPTVHPKIQVAAVREYPYDEALKNEQDLYDLSFTYDDMAIVKKMKEIVPEYKSHQSKYEVLD